MKDRVDFKKAILMSVAVVGVLSVAVLAPNALQVLKPFLNNKRYNKNYYIKQKIKKLEEEGLLKIDKTNDRSMVSLTEKGKQKLEYYKITGKKKQRWDGKWRVVIFDVWEKARSKRDMLRLEIKNFGFIQLQQSVWIYPYECEDFIELLKTDLSFGKNIRYMIVEKLDYDYKLREYFKLV